MHFQLTSTSGATSVLRIAGRLMLARLACYDQAHEGQAVLVRILEGEIKDLERIIAADEAILDIEKSPEKRDTLRAEIRETQNKINKLKTRIEYLSTG